MRRALLVLMVAAGVAGCSDPDSKVIEERANAQAAQAQQMGHSQGTPPPGK
jgi:uncharacterized protein YceK